MQLQLGVAAISPAETTKEHRSQPCGRVLLSGLQTKVRTGAVRTLILKGSDSQQRTTEIYVPSSTIALRYVHAHTP